MTLAALASLLGGRLDGPAELEFDGLGSPLEAAPTEVVVAFDAAAAASAEASGAVAVVLPVDVPCRKPAVRVADPPAAFARLLQHFAAGAEPASGVHPTAVVATGVVLGEDVSIGPYAVLEEGVRVGRGTSIGAHCVIGAQSRLGEQVRLHPQVTLYARTELGDRVVLHAGVVVGADGYGYQYADGVHHKVPQIGRVVIEDDVEVGANTTIDRATVGATRIGAGTKIDNLVQVAHNCRLGRGVLLISQAGLAGSCEIGDYAVLAGQVGVADHVTIGAGAKLVAQAGVAQDVPAGEILAGSPAIPRLEFFRVHTASRRLVDLRRQVERLDRRLQALEAPVRQGADDGE